MSAVNGQFARSMLADGRKLDKDSKGHPKQAAISGYLKRAAAAAKEAERLSSSKRESDDVKCRARLKEARDALTAARTAIQARR